MNRMTRTIVLGLALAAIALPIIGVRSPVSATPNIPGAVMFVQKHGQTTRAFTILCQKKQGMVQKRSGKLACVVPPRSSVGSMRGSYGGGRVVTPVPVASP
jgi:hypothetical protein